MRKKWDELVSVCVASNCFFSSTLMEPLYCAIKGWLIHKAKASQSNQTMDYTYNIHNYYRLLWTLGDKAITSNHICVLLSNNQHTGSSSHPIRLPDLLKIIRRTIKRLNILLVLSFVPFFLLQKRVLDVEPRSFTQCSEETYRFTLNSRFAGK